MAMLQRASKLASKGNRQASFDKHVASPAAKMSFVKHEKLLEEAAQLEAAAQTMLDDKTDGNSVMPDSFRIVDERLAAERAAFHNSQVSMLSVIPTGNRPCAHLPFHAQSHHKGRRLLGALSRRIFTHITCTLASIAAPHQHSRSCHRVSPHAQCEKCSCPCELCHVDYNSRRNPVCSTSEWLMCIQSMPIFRHQ